MRIRALLLLSLTCLLGPVSACQPGEAPSSESTPVSTQTESDRIEAQITIGLAQLKELMSHGESFALIAHRHTCPYCQDTIPFVLDYMGREFENQTEDSAYVPLPLYLVNTQDDRELVDFLTDLLIPLADPESQAGQSGILYIPNLAVFLDGEPVSFEVGLPQTQVLMDERLDQVKAQVTAQP